MSEYPMGKMPPDQPHTHKWVEQPDGTFKCSRCGLVAET